MNENAGFFLVTEALLQLNLLRFFVVVYFFNFSLAKTENEKQTTEK